MRYTESSRDALLYWVYNVLVTLAFVVSVFVVPVLLLMGERFRTGLTQRLGFYPRPIRERVEGSRPIWIHAASVGEVLSAGPLVRELRRQFPRTKLIVSTFTHTGQRLGQKALPVDAVIFLPVDLAWVVRRALGLFEPSMIVFLETEIWPNMLRAASRRGIPVLLVSGRISPQSLRNYLRFGVFFRCVMRFFTALGMQTEEDARRIAQLGAEPAKITVTGSLKLAAQDGRGSAPAEIAAPQKAPGDLLWVVGSSHRGEEELALEGFAALRRRFHNLRMVLAPRHPERFVEIENLLVARGLEFEKRSQILGEAVIRRDVLLLDTIGELLQFYAIGDVAFVGGSLVDAGGHNILEPARHRIPVLFGPYMANFETIADEMKKCGGGIEVGGIDELIHETADLLANHERRRLMGNRAYELAIQGRGVLERTMRLISDCRQCQGGSGSEPARFVL